MIRDFARTLAATAALVCVCSQLPAAQTDLAQLLLALQDDDATVRMNAFYAIRSAGLGATDAAKVAIIRLLRTENTVVNRAPVFPDDPGNRYAAYFGDVIGAVAALDDRRSIDALLGVIDTGDMATRALAGFGTAGLKRLIATGATANPRVRNGTAIALRQIVQLGSANDAASKARIRAALNALAVDPDYYVGIAAIQGLTHLGGVGASGPATRVSIEVNYRDDRDHGRHDDRAGDDSDSRRGDVDLKKNDVIRVAILSSPTFDSLSIDASGVRFGVAGALPLGGGGTAEDVNHDHRQDLVLRFLADESGLRCGDTSTFIVGATLAGEAIVGSDPVKLAGCTHR
jgi:hypothetical protein